MKNYISEGRCIPVIAERDVYSGEPVIVGNMFGIPATSARAGDSFELYIEGIYELRSDGSVFNRCGHVYFDKLAKKDLEAPENPDFNVVTIKKEANVLIGVATETTRQGDAKVRVRLNGVSI